MSILRRRIDRLREAHNLKYNSPTFVFMRVDETHEQAILRTGNQGIDINRIKFVRFLRAIKKQ